MFWLKLGLWGTRPLQCERKLQKHSTKIEILGSALHNKVEHPKSEFGFWSTIIPLGSSVLLQLSLHCRTGYTLLQDCSYTLCAEKGERKLSEHLTGRKTHTPQTFTVCHQQKDRQRLGRDPLTQNIGPQMNGTAFLANIFGLFEHHA